MAEGPVGGRHHPDARKNGRQRITEESGIGLIEVMIAIFILAVGLMAVASVGFSSLRAMSDSELRQRAMALATESIEVARSYPYGSIAMRAGEAGVPATFDHEEGTAADPGTGETVIATSSGLVTGDAHARTAGRLELNTFVTDVDDDTGTRRVTAVVTYPGPGGAPRDVRFTTLIAEAARGLGQPQFDISPPSGRQRVTRDVEEACHPHTLVNRGNADRYEISLPPVVEPASPTPSGTWPTPLVSNVYVYDPDDPASRQQLNPPFEIPVNAGGSIGTGESVGFDVCYEIPLLYSATPSEFETNPVVRSLFLEDREQPLVHVTEVERARNIYLYPELDDDGEVAAQSWDGLSGFAAQSAPLQASPLASYGPDDQPGLRLSPVKPLAGIGPFETAEFVYRFGQSRVVESSTLRLWLRRDTAGEEPKIWARVHQRSEDEGITELDELEPVLLGLTTEWAPYDLDVNAASTYAGDDELIVTVGCLDASALDGSGDPLPTSACRLAFGTVDQPAHLRVEFP